MEPVDPYSVAPMYRVNEKLDISKIPKNTIHISFDSEFNDLVDNLPEGIMYISFGRCFKVLKIIMRTNENA